MSNHPDVEWKIIDYDDYQQFVRAVVNAMASGWFHYEPERMYKDIRGKERYRKQLIRRKYQATGVTHIRESSAGEKTVWHVVMPDGYVANNHDHDTPESAEKHMKSIVAYGFDS